MGIRSSNFPEALRLAAVPAAHDVGAYVFRMGSRTHSVFFIVAGAVRLVRYGRSGEEIVLHDARPGEFFAEASLDSTRYHCDAIARERSDLLRIPAAALRQLLDADREFARQWIALLARQLRTIRSRVERLCLLISEGCGPRCEFALPGTLKDLARDLGLSHEALYRTLAAMERARIITRQGAVLRLQR